MSLEVTERMVLSSANEDYFGLYEIIGELNSTFPQEGFSAFPKTRSPGILHFRQRELSGTKQHDQSTSVSLPIGQVRRLETMIISSRLDRYRR
jgi:hypothetical protein